MTNTYAAVCAAHIGDPDVSASRMFGADGLKVANKVFAMEFKGKLVVKLSRDRAQALIALGTALPFDPGHGRPMKQWIAVASDSGLDWLALAAEAKSAVRG